jgi:hypothetical protein
MVYPVIFFVYLGYNVAMRMARAADDDTAAHAAEEADGHAQAANEVTRTAEDENRRAQVTNEIVAHTENVDHQGQVFDETLFSGTDSLIQHETNGTINHALKELAPYLSMVLGVICPLPVLKGVKVCNDILKDYGIIEDPAMKHLSSLKLAIGANTAASRDVNAALRAHTAASRDVNALKMVKDMTVGCTASIRIDKSDNRATAFFFYAKNNETVARLRSHGYFARDSISQMFDDVREWNHKVGIIYRSRKSVLRFLDEDLPQTNLLDMTFCEKYQDVEIHAHVNSKRSCTISSVEIHKGCSVRYEHLTLCHSCIDVTKGGSAHLHMCSFGSPPPQN